MNHYHQALTQLKNAPRTWVVTGAAGFIGSNLVETLLKNGQRVVGLDNFATGYQHNLDQVKENCSTAEWASFTFIEGDICRLDDCRRACDGVDYVLHEAALGSVPLSMDDPVRSNDSNVNGFVNMLNSARESAVKRFVYAASSATYGDDETLPKSEESIGKPLSPYALTKYINELYADVFARCYGMETVGLRYFNIFGPRQDPKGAYAAVIPCWIAGMIQGEPIHINGDGENTRDFCYVDNVVQANILAATTQNPGAVNQVYNIAMGKSTSLNELYEIIRAPLSERFPRLRDAKPEYRDFRPGDIRHSVADVSKARQLLGYDPEYDALAGLKKAMDWYIADLS